MEAEISIHELLKKGKYEASLITTYNAYLPFYEEVVLKSLVSRGCRHNVLLMDSSQFSEIVLFSSLRPQSAGYDYTLVPMKAGGAFHPKIILLLERKKGVLLVGSHNMTYSGLGINREITTTVEVSDGKEKQGILAAQSAWKFVLRWLEEQRGKVPEELIDAVRAIKRFAPWLSRKAPADTDDVLFMGSSPEGGSLWEAVQGHVSGPIKRLTVMGPFFDKELSFLTTLKKTLSPKEVIVGIDPSTVDIPPSFSDYTGVRFVDASFLAEKPGYLHAKALFIEENRNNCWLVTGSANPSAPAWTNPPDKRNAEAVIIQRGETAFSQAERIGLSKLSEIPELRLDVVTELQSRVSRPKQERPSLSNIQVIVVTAINERIRLPVTLFDQNEFIDAHMLDENQRIMVSVEKLRPTDNEFVLTVEEEVIHKVRFVEIHLKSEKAIFALVHHKLHIAKRAENKRTAQFRAYLDSLNSDSPELDGLIVAVEKVIFDSEDEIDPGVRRTITKKDNETADEKEIDSLAVHLKDTKKLRRKRRMLRSGDLAYLLDVLIYRLGMGLEKQKEYRDRFGRSEEELVGSDDEDTPEKQVELDGAAIVKMCHGKVRRLVSRMVKQFERAASDEVRPDHTITQLVAVLAVLRELRTIDIKAPWMPLGATLVPNKERHRLFTEAIRFLFGRKNHLYKKALEELIEEPLDELSRLRGLLLWLGRECGADFRQVKKTLFGEDRKQEYQRLFHKAHLVMAAPGIGGDELASSEAWSSIKRTTKPAIRRDSKKWLDDHLHFLSVLSGFVSRPCDIPTISRSPKRGDLAYPNLVDHPTLSVVLRTDGRVVTLVDLDRRKNEVGYVANGVTVVNINALEKLVKVPRFPS